MTGRNRRVRGRPATNYAADDPRAYGTPVWWHEASLGVTKDGSNLVSLWEDQIGSTDPASAGASRPTWNASGPNSRPYIRFVNDTLNVALASPLLGADWTVVVVGRNTTAGSTSGTFLRQGHVANNTGLDLTFASGARNVLCKGGANHIGGTMVADTWEIWTASRVSGAAPTLLINGVNDPLTNSGNTTYNTGANTFDYGVGTNVCEIAECFAYAQSGMSLAALITALQAKYAIA